MEFLGYKDVACVTAFSGVAGAIGNPSVIFTARQITTSKQILVLAFSVSCWANDVVTAQALDGITYCIWQFENPSSPGIQPSVTTQYATYQLFAKSGIRNDGLVFQTLAPGVSFDLLTSASFECFAVPANVWSAIINVQMFYTIQN